MLGRELLQHAHVADRLHDNLLRTNQPITLQITKNQLELNEQAALTSTMTYIRNELAALFHIAPDLRMSCCA
jgi:hypothetical protein